MNFAALLKTFDTVMAVRDAARRLKGDAPPEPRDTGMTRPPSGGLGGQIEARLTNVVVAALKEAFDRDRARLDLDRDHYEEQRRRAEEAMRLELRRQMVERELSRLRMLATMAVVGWIASLAMVVARLGAASTPSRVLAALGWVLLLGAMASAFSAQGKVGLASGDSGRLETPAAATALWLLTGGLAMSAASLLF